MIEKINLSTFEITGNNVLVKLNPNYDFKEIAGPHGTNIQLQLIDPSINHIQNLSITGTILKAPERLLFHVELKTHKKGITIAGDEFESLMRESMPFYVDLNVKEGDKVIFDYKQGLTAEDEGRLLDVEGYGYCMLMPYHTLFAKEADGEVVPLNGWVLIKRDQREEEVRSSGIIIPESENKYLSNYATVVVADKPVKEYIEIGVFESQVELNPGDRILVQKGFGYRIAYDTHAGELKGVEGIRRRHILCIFENGI